MSFGSGSELGFGISIGLDNNVTGPAGDVVRSMKSVDQAATELSNNLNSNLASVESVTKGYQDTIERSQAQMSAGLGVMAAGLATLAPIGFGVKMAGELEMAQIGFTTLLGSSEEAARSISNLRKDAAATPFEFKGILDTNRALIAATGDADKARSIFMALGNVTSAFGQGEDVMVRMAQNLQGIKSTGKAAMMDIRQFTNVGIPLWDLMSESTGKTVAELKEADITFEMITQALRKAGGEGGKYQDAMNNMSNSIMGKFSTFSDEVKNTFAEMGIAIMPFLHPIIDFFTKLVRQAGAFMGTKIGKYFVLTAVSVGILLTVMGALLFVTGAVRGASANLALTFLKMVPATVAEAFAVGGLTAGMSALAASVWAAMAPILPFIAAAAALVGVMYLLMSVIGVEGNQWEKFKTLVTATAEVFSSWNGETATMSRETRDNLQKLGLLEFFQNMSTWIVRIKELGKGFFTPLIETGQDLFALFAPIGELFDQVIGLLREMGIDIGGLSGDVSTFNTIGVVLGYVFNAFLIPLRFTINAIGVLVQLITWTVGKIRELVAWFKNWDGSMNQSSAWVQYLSTAIDILLAPVNMLIEGFRTLIDLGSGLGKIISETGIFEMIFGTEKDQGTLTTPESDTSKKSDSISQKIAENKTAQSKANQNQTGEKTPPQPIVIHNNTIVDGEVVAKTTNKVNSDEDNRVG